MSFSKILGKFIYLIDKRRRKYVFTNFDLVFPNLSEKEKKNLANKFYENFAKNLIDFIKYRNISIEVLKEIVEFEGLEKVKEFFNKPVIFITAHYGNWELIPLIIGGVLNLPVTIVVRNLDNKFLNKIFKQHRERYNIKTINKKGALKVLMKDIKNGRSIGLLVDQNTSKNEGVDVEMFGLKALHTPSAALLSKKFNYR